MLVFGKNGQIASALQQLTSEALFLDRKTADFNNPDQVLHSLKEHKPKIVINASAYTAVDQAEIEKDQSFQINAETPGLIARWCHANDCTLIHYSTDYVFDGRGEKPWVEDDPTAPVNWYGHTKLEGEKKILASSCRFYIFRISWVYSPWGQNFPKTILKLAHERETLKVVNDQWGAPTNAMDVAQVTFNLTKLLKEGQSTPPFGIYHLRFEEYQTWYQFADRIIQKARASGELLKVKELLPVTSQEFPTRARRPANSRLGTKFSMDLFSKK